MNKLTITAVLKKNPTYTRHREGGDLLNFTACNTERIIEPNGRLWKKRVVWLDCTWHNPDFEQMPLFKAKSLVYLEGMISERPYTTEEGDRGVSVHLDIVKAYWIKQMGHYSHPYDK